MGDDIKEQIAHLKAVIAGDFRPPPKPDFDPLKDVMFAAASGVALAPDKSLNLSGIILRPAFAHIMFPSLIAFGKPPNPRAPHPGPWSSLAGGGVDVLVEIEVTEAAGLMPLGFDRLNAVWFVIAMIRLVTGAGAFVPFLSDHALHRLGAAGERAHRIPVEIGVAYQFMHPPRTLTDDEIERLVSLVPLGAEMVKDARFHRAFSALDGISTLTTASSRLVMAWGVIETLLGVGDGPKGDPIAKALAALLEPSGPQRDRAFSQFREGYKARCRTVHAAHPPGYDHAEAVVGVARRTLLKAIELGRMPELDELLTAWKTR